MKRWGAVLVCFIVSIIPVLAQEGIKAPVHRYVVSGAGDVVPIPENQSAQEAISGFLHAKNSQVPDDGSCDSVRSYGDSPASLASQGYNPEEDRLFLGHKDVLAEWFIAPATGTLDSIYLLVSPSAADSASNFPHFLYLRIFKSNIYPGHGPGWAPYIAPPRVCWGFYNSIWDDDNGIAPFKEIASDTTWMTSYQTNNDYYTGYYGPSGSSIINHYNQLANISLTTYPPTGNLIWGGTAGFQMWNLHRGMNSLSLDGAPPKPVLQKGETFFITFQNPGIHPPDYVSTGIDPTRVLIDVSYLDGLGGDPSRGEGNPDTVIRRDFHSWVFYEHRRYCFCGWVAEGGGAVNLWYVMTARSDVPPEIISLENLGHTIHPNDARTVHASIADCNIEDPLRAGIDHAELHYSVNDGLDNVVIMTHIGGDEYTADIPGQDSSTSVRYYMIAADSNGNITTSGSHIYRNLSLSSNWYVVDTGASRSGDPISPAKGGSGNPIDPSRFFLPWNSGPYQLDNGTAGPFLFNHPMKFFADSFYYAWIGINGGIAVSKNATDTMHLNANGQYGHWLIPMVQRRQPCSPYDQTINGIPRNFIGGLFTNLLLGSADYNYYTHQWQINYILGAIYYQDSPDRFIVEWDSIGCFNNSIDPLSDETTFRIVLNKYDGSIEFQYDDIGHNGVDTTGIIAIESDSSNLNEQHGYLLINDYGYPRETVPRNNWCIKLWPSIQIAVADGWNMISFPGVAADNHKKALFPGASSDAFAYVGRYSPDSLIQMGRGYWLKFAGSGNVSSWNPVLGLDIPLRQRWNMIGSVAQPVAAADATTAPVNIIASPYWWYDGSTYAPASVIEPGRAYWVKSDSAGTLHLASGSAAKPEAAGKAASGAGLNELAGLNHITFHSGRATQTLYLGSAGQFIKPLSYYELPPLPPSAEVEGFDARFSTGRMAAEYPDDVTKTSLAIDLTTGKRGPMNISWSMRTDSALPAGYCFILTDEEKTLGEVSIRGCGAINLEGALSARLLIKAVPASSIIPREYALSQNYPNPFNPSTRFRVDVPKTGLVTLTIYDLLGRRIALLADGEQAPGTRIVRWDGMTSMGLPVPSGAYFVRMTAEGFTAIKKILLMR